MNPCFAMATSDAPISIKSVSLLVRNQQQVASFYRDIIGLDLISNDGEVVTLGQGDKPLLHLYQDAAARSLPHDAGLFHTAFLLPQRSDLGSWLKHASQAGIKLDGASDHLVSEALYLQDPEGNGIEVYVDRDRSEWTYTEQGIVIDTTPLDIDDILSKAQSPWQGLPNDSVIGHVHLQVGDIEAADAFYRDELGLQRMAQIPQASFYSSGGYHHHLACNTWHSDNAGTRTKGSAGLSNIEFAVESLPGAKKKAIDPWGTHLSFSTG